MKKKLYTGILSGCLLLSVMGCNDLSEVDPSNLSGNNFPTPNNPATYSLLAGDVFSQLRPLVKNWNSYWELVNTCTDEMVIPTRAGDWGDGNMWRNMHLHEWTKTQNNVGDVWNVGYVGIGKCNLVLKVFEGVSESDQKKIIVAQIRTIRALFYYFMMEVYGNIPIVTNFDETTPPANTARTNVWNFLVKELTEITPILPLEVNANTYGMPTQWMAKTLLAKLYLNAKVYTGEEKWTEAIAACDDVINSSKYVLNPDYMSIFASGNGPSTKEIIFAIPMDVSFNAAELTFWQRVLPGATANKFRLPTTPWNGHCTLPEFYALYNDPNDQRNAQWLVGKQTARYKKINGQYVDVPEYTLQVNGADMVITPEIPWGKGDAVNPFNVGNTPEGLNAGVRNVKYYPEANSINNSSNNDFVVFRYADILLMKAEAEARKANNAALALPAINALRTVRGAAPLATATFQTILDERGREFAWELWRRNDLIRFGQWGGKWGINPGKPDSHLLLFPIPQTAINANPNLKQNPGYN